MVNQGGRKVFYAKGGFFHPTDITIPPERLEDAILKIARNLGGDISAERPILNTRLDDGSRVSAVWGAPRGSSRPIAVDGHTLTIRKFGQRYTLEQLVEQGSVPQAVATMLVEDILEHRNILISGGTGTGKTTLLNALAASIPPHERVVLIEDNAEILIHTPNLVRLQSREAEAKLGADEPLDAITIRQLVKAALRENPDRIILGEVRGGEARDLLRALNTGHSGSACTLHANSATTALTALSHMAVEDRPGDSPRSVREAIALAIHTVVHIGIDRLKGERHITQVLRVQGYNATDDQFITTALYTLARDRITS
jgi:pilus assembly protein CpaF